MKVKVKSNRVSVERHRTIKLEVGKFTVTEKYINDVLKSQVWSVGRRKGFKSTHPDAYEPQSMVFQYFDDISFFSGDDCISYESVPKPVFVKDWSTFKGLNHVLCIYLGMDGNIYRIDKEKPIPIWRHKSYIAGFTNEHFNLDEVVKKLQRKSWIKNIVEINIPWYNSTRTNSRAVEFDYKLQSSSVMVTRLSKEFPDKYIGS